MQQQRCLSCCSYFFGLITSTKRIDLLYHSGMLRKSNVSLISGMVIGLFRLNLLLAVSKFLDGNETALVSRWIGMAFLCAMVVAMFKIDPSRIKAETEEKT